MLLKSESWSLKCCIIWYTYVLHCVITSYWNAKFLQQLYNTWNSYTIIYISHIYTTAYIKFIWHPRLWTHSSFLASRPLIRILNFFSKNTQSEYLPFLQYLIFRKNYISKTHSYVAIINICNQVNMSYMSYVIVVVHMPQFSHIHVNWISWFFGLGSLQMMLLCAFVNVRRN